MTRELPPEPDEEKPEPPHPGHVRTTSPRAVLAAALVGLVLGFLVRPTGIRLEGSAPKLGWTPVLALGLGAAILAMLAWYTYRDLHRRGVRLEPYKTVNRLVLAKAGALAGAVVAGGYLGNALSWWRAGEVAHGDRQLLLSLGAAGFGVLIVAASLLLERACRVPGGRDSHLP